MRDKYDERADEIVSDWYGGLPQGGVRLSPIIARALRNSAADAYLDAAEICVKNYAYHLEMDMNEKAASLRNNNESRARL